jgi:opacity protein-like surface antigen
VNRFVFSSFAAAAIAVAAPAAQAQDFNPFQIGASGGVAIPVSDLKDAVNMGYNIGVHVGFKSQFSPIAVRAEAAWNQFGFKDQVGGNGSINIPAFTGNLIFGLPLPMPLSPYAIGGVGLYRPSASISGAGNTDSENDFGFNVGAGIKVPLSSSFETFVEARYHRLNLKDNGGNLSFVPITVGITF